MSVDVAVSASGVSLSVACFPLLFPISWTVRLSRCAVNSNVPVSSSPSRSSSSVLSTSGSSSVALVALLLGGVFRGERTIGLKFLIGGLCFRICVVVDC